MSPTPAPGSPEAPFITDCSSEEWVEYHYEGDKKHRIVNPVERHIFMGKSGWTQRVIDGAGVTHRPTPGWLAMSWKPKPGQPAYVA
jgi:hypothetical protein